MSRIFGPIIQNGYVVPDLTVAIRHWSETLGVGPFFAFPTVEFAEVEFRGKSTACSIAIAIAFSGDLQIELIQPTNNSPSVFREFMAAGRQGLHHVGVASDRFGEEFGRLTAAGCRLAMSGRTAAGTGFAYFDTEDGFPGSMVELFEADTGLVRLFARARDAARTWDGSEPVRYLKKRS